MTRVVNVLTIDKCFKGDLMHMCFVQRRLMCCSPVKNGKSIILLIFWVISFFWSFSYKIMKIMWCTDMVFQGFNEFWKSEKKYSIMSFPWIFFRARMKGMLDGIFKFFKVWKALKEDLSFLCIYFCAWERVSVMGFSSFRESEKHLKKTLGGSFFVSLVPLGRKRDNLPLESTLIIKQWLECSFCVISCFGPKKE